MKYLKTNEEHDYFDKSPVHVVLVSLLVDQLFGLFLIYFGRPKKNCPVSGNFWSVSGNFWSTKKKFCRPKRILVYQKEIWLTKNSLRLTKNSLRLDKFFWSTKKNEKKTRQLVDQETDQNHMDGTIHLRWGWTNYLPEVYILIKITKLHF